MFRISLRLIAAPAIATTMALVPCAASAQGFLNDLFGNSDRVSPSQPPAQQAPAQQAPAQERQHPAQWQQQPPRQQGTAGQGYGDEISQRIVRLEAQIRQLTGAIEQLQHRNQQLEAQVQRMQGTGAVPRGMTSPTQTQPQPMPQTQPQHTQPPAAQPGRRGEVFDPSQHPNAPGAPRVLGTMPSQGGGPAPIPGNVAQGNPGYDDEAVGAPGGRGAGAPLDLSTLAGAAATDRALSQGAAGNEPPQAAPRGQGGGAQVATLPPSDSPRDSYDMAYGYMMRKDYALAEDGFRHFLRRFSSDRLVPDAQYWLGESMFQRQRYRDAAEQFLGVSTKFETSARAPDALLRLGQSLAAMGEREAACASLGEVLRKYPRASVAVRQGVEREQKRVRC
jgi:tol-pal system protein YbgF